MLQFLFGRAAANHPADAITFTYHRKSAIRVLLLALLMAAFVETVVLHFLISMWSHLVAWLATASSLWIALTVVAQIRSLSLRPIYLHQGQLHLRNGMYELAVIPVRSIDSVEVTARPPVAVSEGEKPLNACFPAGHNVVIRLDQEREATLLYGQRKTFRTALVHVDEPARLHQALVTPTQESDEGH